MTRSHTTKIAVVDYGASNIHSVQRAVEHVGLPAVVTSDPDVIGSAEGIILPGVGAAADTMCNLRDRGLVHVVKDSIARGTPFLGVCMGLQALFTVSLEGGEEACLDVLPGTVRRFPPGLSIPHMGWNQVKQRRAHPIFDGIPDEANFYFVHSYYVDPADLSVVAGTTDYGIEFPSVVVRDNVMATQFHAEKSGDHGLRLYANFGRIVQGELTLPVAEPVAAR